MKKRISLVLALTLLAVTFIVTPVSAAPKPGDTLGWVLNSDVTAYIDGYPIRSYNINGYTYIVAEDLMSYGFNVEWRGSEAKLIIHRGRIASPDSYTSRYQHAANTEVPGTPAFQYFYTDITAWIDNTQITGYNIGGNTCVCMDDVAAFFGTDYIWDGNTNTLKLITGEMKSDCERNGHSYAPATCTSAKICRACGATFGQALGHTTSSGICSRCNINFFKPITYTGTGKKVVTGLNLDEGLYVITMKHSGDSNFIVVPYNGDGDRLSSWTNEIGNYGGSVVHTEAIKNGYIDVKADGNWEITISTVTETGTSNLKGYGDCVSPFFELPKGAQVVSLNYSGDSNFIVVVYDDTGDRYSSLANEIGSFSGQTVFNEGNPDRKFCIEVTASGSWSIDFGLGSQVTTCEPPAVASSGTSDNNDRDYEDDDDSGYSEEKWDSDEALELNEYAAAATKAYNQAMDKMNQALKSKNLASSYMSTSFSYMSQALRYLESAERLLTDNVELELTGGDYDTVSELVEDLIDDVEEYIDDNEDSDSDISSVMSVSTKLVKFGPRFIHFQKLTVDLIEKFVR